MGLSYIGHMSTFAMNTVSHERLVFSPPFFFFGGIHSLDTEGGRAAQWFCGAALVNDCWPLSLARRLRPDTPCIGLQLSLIWDAHPPPPPQGQSVFWGKRTVL